MKIFFLAIIIFFSTVQIVYSHDDNTDITDNIDYQISLCQTSFYQNLLQLNNAKKSLDYINDNKYYIPDYIDVVREAEYDVATLEIRIRFIKNCCDELIKSKKSTDEKK